MKVKEAMHKTAEWRQPETPVMEIAKLMTSDDVGSIPIGENDKLIGMVTDRDIIVRAVANGGDLSNKTARDVMTSGIVYCREEDDINDAVKLMEEKQIRRLPVIDEGKRLVGMLSLGDIAHASQLQLSGELLQSVSAHH